MCLYFAFMKVNGASNERCSRERSSCSTLGIVRYSRLHAPLRSGDCSTNWKNGSRPTLNVRLGSNSRIKPWYRVVFGLQTRPMSGTPATDPQKCEDFIDQVQLSPDL